jgi:hypothetical protein
VNAGELEAVVDELGEPVGLDPELGVVATQGLRLVGDAVLQRLAHRPDAGKGVTQVV